jgi:GDP-L-fucose synthase
LASKGISRISTIENSRAVEEIGVSMDKNSRIFVAGHRGLVGSALVNKLKTEGCRNLILRTHEELDLRDQLAVKELFAIERPEHVVIAAAKVGGIIANSTFPGDFIYDNLQIQTNIIHNAYLTGVERLLFLGSTCIYPKYAPQPMKEECLLSGALESTSEPYAVAKIAGLTMCRAYNHQYGTKFLTVMPTTIYGPNDNFDLQSSHVLPALIRKFHEAKVKCSSAVDVWGTGSPLREFLFVDDLADACLYLLTLDDERFGKLLAAPDSPAMINIGTGEEISIKDLAMLVKEVVHFEGRVEFLSDKPDGTPRKLADSSRIHSLGWHHKTPFEVGLKETYRWFLSAVGG